MHNCQEMKCLPFIYSMYGRELLNHRRNTLKVSDVLPPHTELIRFALQAEGLIQNWCSRLMDSSTSVRVLYCSASTNLEITEGPRCQSRLHRKKECFIILLFPRHYTLQKLKKKIRILLSTRYRNLEV
jgi:hypothetical protein